MPSPKTDSPAGSAPALDRALVSAFLANVPENVYFKDLQSRFIAVSASQLRYLGKTSQAEVVGRTDFDFFSANHAHPAFLDEQQIIRTGESIIGKLEREVWPDGRVTWAMTSKMPLRDEQGRIIGTFGVSKDVTQARQMEEALDKARKEVIDASRLAGMAEVATGVLHNVGNVLNSVNVSANVIAASLRQSKIESLAKVCAMLDEHAADLGGFLTSDPKGRLVPEFLKTLCRHAAEERVRLTQELEFLQKNIDHIKEIVAMQQAYATMAGVVETLVPANLMEDAIHMNAAALVRHDVTVVRDYQPVLPVRAERGKVLQILINLIRNAKYACDEGRTSGKSITLRVAPGSGGTVAFVVSDNGVGIPAENLTRIFQHGFTTRPGGHGFGLHSSALAAKEMQGSLAAQSAGSGAGATFVLELPIADPAAAVAA
jgi:PAS domain S-box-containing protein